MQLKKLLVSFFFTLVGYGHAQLPQLSPLSKVSVLTTGPGDVLYSAFGHSAFRVQDPSLGIDVVYNYGVFDTGSENFYLKFAQGRMYYRLARQGFNSYLEGYKMENRWVKEQVLDLSVQDRNSLFEFLEKNYLPENQQYQYDYFLNNCATKIWDVLKENLENRLVFDPTYIAEEFTFRELIHHNIKTNSWGAFGIDVALGSVIDRKATPKEHMYLPIYILQQLKVAQLDGKPLANKETDLFEARPTTNGNHFFTSPLFFMLAVSAWILGITYLDYKKGKRNRWLDFFLFLLTGAAGTILFFLWFLTDHIWTVGNYNLLWAFPANLILAFLVVRRSPRAWISKYVLFLLVLLTLLLVLWILKVQYFTPVLIPLLVALAGRFYYIFHSCPKHIKLK